AVAIVREKGESLDVVISDVRMPRLDGVAAFREIKKLRPGLPVILMTAFTQEKVVFEAMVDGVFTVVNKPFDAGRLLQIAERAVTRPQVLVVDDSPEFLESLSAGLRLSGQTPIATKDGREALQAIRESNVDVAVIDLILPGKDGIGVLEDVKREKPSVRAIMITGEDVPDLVQRASVLGSHTALRKPFDIRELVRIIAEVRGKTR
ncbi:MAG: response regulator, partial [Planctomycetota bacterium]